jgi:hypothetical protein
MKVKLIKITPEWAAELLQRNTRNRPINMKHVDRLAKEILGGRWKVNGDTICLNDERIIDGQHRLHAIVQANVTVETLVAFDVPSDVFDTKDVGKRRSAGDTFSVAGEQNACRLAASLIMIDKYMTGRVESSVAYSNTEMEVLLLKYPEARSSIQSTLGKKGLITPSVLDACHYLFSRKDPVLADEFVEKVLKGAGLEEGTPWYVLRERLVNNSLSKAKLSKAYLMAICIKAWNHVRAGTKVRYLKFGQEGQNTEAFPLIR